LLNHCAPLRGAARPPGPMAEAAEAGSARPWLRDVRVEVAALETTGGKVWVAAHELCDFLERRWGELGLGPRPRVLEIGAGCGWLGLCLARNLPGVEVCMTEQPAGLEHLQRNIELNREAGLPVDSVRCAALDWADLASAEGLLSERWDLIIGSDLLYAEAALRDLPALFGRLAGASTRVLYAHTLHRYDHLDVEFFKALKAAGLEFCEIGDIAPDDEAFLVELFPEERPAVFEIAHAASASRPGRVPALAPRARPAREEAPRIVEIVPQPEEAVVGNLGVRVLLPDDGEGQQQEDDETQALPVVRLAVVGPFGNTSHPTTRLVLRWMVTEEGRDAIRSRAVLDYGCGSGILGIVALTHGAGSCSAVDNDLAALEAAKANAAANGLQMAVHLPGAEVLDRDLDFYTRFGNWRSLDDLGWTPLPSAAAAEPAVDGGPFPVVLCNIVVGPLCRVAPTLHELCGPGGFVVLAGFRGDYMRTQVEEAYGALFELADRGREAGWQLLVGRRKPSAAAAS